MGTWIATTVCAVCNAKQCECDIELQRVEWTLRNDRGDDLAIVQYFDGNERWYGNTAYGRTGPTADLDACKRRVERMLETGSDRP